MHNVDRAENEMQNTSTGLDLQETQSVRDGAWRMKLRETGSNWDGENGPKCTRRPQCT